MEKRLNWKQLTGSDKLTKTTTEITRAFAISETDIMLSVISTEWDAYEPQSIIIQCNYDKTTSWKKGGLGFHTQTITSFTPDTNSPDFSYYIVMSSNGEIYHYHPDKPFKEYIFGAGDSYDGSKDIGRLMNIRQIGDKLYACGSAGQLYVRHGRDDWQPLTKALLWSKEEHNRTLNAGPKDRNTKEYREWRKKLSQQQKKKNPRVRLIDINGPSEDEIYICGDRGQLYLWNGKEIEDLEIGFDRILNTIHVASDADIWVCGISGQILRGNEEEGFDDVSTHEESHLLSSITTYDGKHFFASQTDPFGLYEYDENAEELKHVRPDIKPGLRSIHTVQAVGDVLWVVGTQDILRLKNGIWERVEHPDMPAPK